MTSQPDRRAQVRRTFDELAAVYDAVGVDFFGPIAQGLVDALDLSPGEHVLDIGCGAGAFLLPASQQVAAAGTAHGIDLSPAMVERARAIAAASGRDNITAEVDDAQEPALTGQFDVIGSSLVLFFLPDPAAALVEWRRLLRPGGRLGLATFGPRDATVTALDDLFTPYLPPHLLDARTSGTKGPFATDGAMEDLVTAAGYGRATTITLDLPVRFRDVDQWVAFSQSTGQSAMWAAAPPEAHAEIRASAEQVLAGSPHPEGGSVEYQQVRYTLADRD